MTDLSDDQRIAFEAAAFRRLRDHLRERTDVQNIDLMNLAGFCRNCLSNWYREAAEADGIRLGKEDRLVAAAIVAKEATLLVAGENGIGKRTEFDEYRVQSRGGKGIITMKTTAKTGGGCGALAVRDTDEIMLITVGGQMVRTGVEHIRMTGRNAQGVKLINLHGKDQLQAIAPVISEDAADTDAED